MRSVTCYMFPQESYGWYKNQETKKSVFGRTLNVRRTPPRHPSHASRGERPAQHDTVLVLGSRSTARSRRKTTRPRQ